MSQDYSPGTAPPALVIVSVSGQWNPAHDDIEVKVTFNGTTTAIKPSQPSLRVPMTSITSPESSSVHVTVQSITLSVESSSVLLSPVLTDASTLESDDGYKIQLLRLRSPEDGALIEELLQKVAIANQAKEARNVEFKRDMAAKDLEISNLRRDMATKDLELSDSKRSMTAKDLEISNLKRDMTTKDLELSESKRSMTAKDLEISNLKRDMTTKDLKLSESKRNMTAKDLELSELTGKLDLFLDYVLPIRRGWHAGSRKVLINGAWRYFRGRPEEKHIRERNAAVHHGHFLIDQALFSMGRLSNAEEFEARYGCPPTTAITSQKVITIVNMRATLVGCFLGTAQTHSETSDKEFNDLYNRCRNWWIFHLSDENFKTLTKEEQNSKFEEDFRIEKYYQAMIQIEEQTVRLHKAWLSRHMQPLGGSRS